MSNCRRNWQAKTEINKEILGKYSRGHQSTQDTDTVTEEHTDTHTDTDPRTISSSKLELTESIH